VRKNKHTKPFKKRIVQRAGKKGIYKQYAYKDEEEVKGRQRNTTKKDNYCWSRTDRIISMI